MNGLITLRYSRIKFLALLYIIVPICLFFLGWLKWYFAFPGVVLLGIGAWQVFKGNNPTLKSEPSPPGLRISLLTLAVIAAVVLAWSFLAGQGGFFYQSSDHHWRNAIFRDLINHPWPVRYSYFNSTMVYYIGHWLVPASIGKAVAHFGGIQAGWLAGNISLYLWTSTGLFLVALLLIQAVGTPTRRVVGLSLFCLVFFSGLDIIGILPQVGSLTNLPDHLEWWAKLYQLSSNTTLLFWVFNQTVVPWLVLLLIINEQKVSNFAFYGLAVLPFGPLPFVGLAIIMASLVVKQGLEAQKDNKVHEFLQTLFSPQNIIAILTILPIYGLYYAGNSATANQGFRMDLSLISGTLQLMTLMIFYLLEFGVYAIILFKYYRNDWLFLTAVISLSVIPLFKMGYGTDFAMRATIPALFLLMIYIIRHLNQTIEVEGPRLKMPVSTAVLAIALILGSITPMVEYRRAFNGVIAAGKLNAVADNIITFDRTPPEHDPNFLSGDPEKRPFYKYLAK